MKVFIIGQKGIPAISGGVERHVEELATRLVDEGHEVTVYCRKYYNPQNLKEYKGIRLITLPSMRTKHFDAVSHTLIASLDVLRRKADVVHYHSIGPAMLLWIPKIFKRSAKVVFTFHCADYNHRKWGKFAQNFLQIGERFGCYFADQIITVSQTLRHYVKDRYHKMATYIPNGAPQIEVNKNTNLIKQWGLENKNYILTVSRLVKHKGVHHLIEAYKKIKTDKKLVVVGSSAFTDEYVSHLHELAAGNENIIFTGQQTGETLEQLYSNAYTFVQPSESEGLSIALLEALQYELAVLSSDIPENKEVVRDVGFMFKNKSVADLKRKLSFLLDNPDYVENLGKRGREYVQTEYNWDKITKETSNLYNRATGKAQEGMVYKPVSAK